MDFLFFFLLLRYDFTCQTEFLSLNYFSTKLLQLNNASHWWNTHIDGIQIGYEWNVQNIDI